MLLVITFVCRTTTISNVRPLGVVTQKPFPSFSWAALDLSHINVNTHK